MAVSTNLIPYPYKSVAEELDVSVEFLQQEYAQLQKDILEPNANKPLIELFHVKTAPLVLQFSPIDTFLMVTESLSQKEKDGVIQCSQDENKKYHCIIQIRGEIIGRGGPCDKKTDAEALARGTVVPYLRGHPIYFSLFLLGPTDVLDDPKIAYKEFITNDTECSRIEKTILPEKWSYIKDGLAYCKPRPLLKALYQEQRPAIAAYFQRIFPLPKQAECIAVIAEHIPIDPVVRIIMEYQKPAHVYKGFEIEF